MRDGQALDYDTLHSEAAAAAAGVRQTELADGLGVSQGVVSRALKEPGARYAKMQARIIEHLTDFQLVEVPERYRVVRKEPTAD
jgi:ribosome-binding protein aMBF1 (putative translation factor)